MAYPCSNILLSLPVTFMTKEWECALKFFSNHKDCQRFQIQVGAFIFKLQALQALHSFVLVHYTSSRREGT